MIFADAGPHLLVFTQCDHAALAARLLGLWRRDGLPQSPRREEILFATREHDNGWQRADSAPTVSPQTGRPVSFDHMPPAARLEIWQRGVHRHEAEHPYACRLIARHARLVNQNTFGCPGWQDFEVELDTLDGALCEHSDVDEVDMDSDYGRLELADILSLGACGALGRGSVFEGSSRGYRFALALGSIRLAPFPLAGVTTLEIPCRELPKRAFSNSAELAAELARATWKRLPVKVESLRP